MANAKKGLLKKVFKGLKSYFKPYTGLILLSLLCALIVTAATLLIPIFLGKAINTLSEGAGTVDMSIVLSNVTLSVICLACLFPAQYGLNIINNYVSYSMVAKIRTTTMHHIEHLALSYLDDQATGDIVSRIIADMDTFQEGMIMTLTQLFTGVFTIVGAIFLMSFLNWKIMLIVLVLTPASILMTKLFSKFTYKRFKDQSVLRGKETAFINEMISQQKIVQAYGAQELTQKGFSEVDHKLAKASESAVFISSLLNPSTRFINNVIYALVVLVGSLLVSKGTMELGTLSTFLAYTSIYTKPFNEITGVITELQNAIVCGDRILQVLDEPLEVENKKQHLEYISGEVFVDDINFSYVPDKPLIEHWSLKVKPGMKVAIVGPTGCGKTTMINLLMRFYDPQSGRIYLEHIDTQELGRQELRKNIGMVLQDTWLKEGTVFENVAFGKPNATLEEVEKACKAAHCDSFIRKLPHGYQTVLSENGGRLSQGEKQLLCIARLMLDVPPILILDEATSSIDTRTEMLIQDAFNKMMEGRTSFIVAHRLQTIRHSDLIIVMKDGHIVEQGHHADLLKQDGFYAHLWNSQFE